MPEHHHTFIDVQQPLSAKLADGRPGPSFRPHPRERAASTVIGITIAPEIAKAIVTPLDAPRYKLTPHIIGDDASCFLMNFPEVKHVLDVSISIGLFLDIVKST